MLKILKVAFNIGICSTSIQVRLWLFSFQFYLFPILYYHTIGVRGLLNGSIQIYWQEKKDRINRNRTCDLP